MDEYIGMIKIFAGTFVPRNWFGCTGQLISVNQYNALFSVLGTTYGGDGRITFGLPNLMGRVPIGMGQGPGLSNYTQAQIGGTQTNTLTVANLEAHTHPASLKVSDADASQGAATANASIATPGTLSGRTFTATLGYNTATPNTLLNPASVATGLTGQGTPVNNMQPFIAVNYIICWSGIYPPRP